MSHVMHMVKTRRVAIDRFVGHGRACLFASTSRIASRASAPPYAGESMAPGVEVVPRSPRRESGSWLARLTPPSIAGLAVMLSIGVKPLAGRLADPDIWWHLKTGQLIVARHALPAGDPYSITAAGKPWVVQEWGSEVILRGIDSAFGLRGIIVWRALMILAVYALVARLIIKRTGNTLLGWALVALTAYAGAKSWTERPNLFSFLLFVVTLMLAVRRDRMIWWFVPIAVVWANLHGMVLLGLGLVALLAAIEGLKVALHWEGADARVAKRVALVTGVAVAATFLNPYGPGLLAHGFRLVRIVSPVVTEWASPDFHEAGSVLFLAIAVVTVAALGLARRRPDPTDVGLTVAFLVLGLVAVRNLTPSAIVLGYVASRSLPDAIEASLARRSQRATPSPVRRLAALNLAAMAAVVGVFAFIGAARFPGSSSLDEVIEPTYPVSILQGLDGRVRLFTTDEWAGLALYLQSPDLRVVHDTRHDFYGTRLIRFYGRTLAGRPGWQERLNALCVTDVLIPSGAGLADAIAGDAGWQRSTIERLEKTRALLFVRASTPPRCPVSPV